MNEHKIPLETFDDPNVNAATVYTIGGEGMSENIEINEDNCVLSEDEIACIQVTFEEKFVTHGELYTDKLDKIFQKITKLNDMAKQAKEKSK
jgi:catabolite regulation protein CreA